MKKAVSLLIIIAVAFSLCSCSFLSNNPQDTTTSSDVYKYTEMYDDLVHIKYDPKDFYIIGNEFHYYDDSC